MISLPAQVRELDAPFSDQIAAHIETLEKRIAAQQATMDRAASIMVEAIATEDGIDPEQAEACIKVIRSQLAEVGKTTAEHYLEKLFGRIAATAGIRAGDEFDPLAVLDHIRTVLAAQANNAKYLEWTIGVLWHPGPDGGKARMELSTGCGCCGAGESFPPGTTWMQALDKILADKAARAAPAAAVA